MYAPSTVVMEKHNQVINFLKGSLCRFFASSVGSKTLNEAILVNACRVCT